MEVGGSLGGVGVVSLCEGGGLHARVLSAGHARAHDVPVQHQVRDHDGDDAKALLFTIHRTVVTRSDAEAPGTCLTDLHAIVTHNEQMINIASVTLNQKQFNT